ncbi:FEKKY domain-containing protein [Riemerella anatipestifer]|uniref:FEKKY domain-containing protein n=1 Tax=Riemerella anatipestifer TaxID=34085 RepID=UPI0030C58B31
MVRRLTILNITILLLIFIANITVFYGINYPCKFDLFYNFEQYGFEYVLIVLLIITLLTVLISTLNIKNYNFKNKFLIIFAIFNFIFLTFLTFTGFSEYKKNRMNYLKLENEYIKMAKEDIKNDNVIFKYPGGLTIPECSQNIENKIDSIHKKYGVKYLNTGCIVMNENIKAQERYEEIVKPYLEKRNGINWETKMKNEIENIKRDCR